MHSSELVCTLRDAHLMQCSIPPLQGRWVYYNDEKVAASKQPPFSLGYLYLYRRRE